MQQANKKHDPPNCVGYCLECEYGEMSQPVEPGEKIVAVLIVDVERALSSYGVDVYTTALTNPDKYKKDAVWLLAMNCVQTLYCPISWPSQMISRTAWLDALFTEQNRKPIGTERSMSVCDMVAFPDGFVWVLTGRGWEVLNA